MRYFVPASGRIRRRCWGAIAGISELPVCERSRRETPPADEQEPLSALVRHHEDPGRAAMLRDVYRVPAHRPDALTGDAQTILDAARALRSIGIEVLRDVAAHVSDELEYALRARAGTSESGVRRFLMYTAGEDFVRGDLPVRRFVAHALGVKAVSALRAEGLVRGAAHELILSPRLLDYRIWMFGASAEASALLHTKD